MRIEVENEQIIARKKQEYEDLVKEMDEKGYEARLKKISIITANLFGVILLAIVGGISFGAYALIYGKSAIDYDKIEVESHDTSSFPCDRFKLKLYKEGNLSSCIIEV